MELSVPSKVLSSWVGPIPPEVITWVYLEENSLTSLAISSRSSPITDIYQSIHSLTVSQIHAWYIFSCPLLKCNIFFKYGNGGLFLLINRNLDLPKSRVSDPLLSSQEKESRSETFDLGKWNWNKMFVDRWFSKINSFSKLLLVLYKGNFIEVETKSVNYL